MAREMVIICFTGGLLCAYVVCMTLLEKTKTPKLLAGLALTLGALPSILLILKVWYSIPFYARALITLCILALIASYTYFSTCKDKQVMRVTLCLTLAPYTLLQVLALVLLLTTAS